MKGLLAGLLAIVLAGQADAQTSSAGSAQAPAAPAVHRYIVSLPKWVAKPDAAAIRSAYPKDALRRGLAGRVRLNCKITPEGALEACQVTTEEPLGQGFGAAALSLAPKFRIEKLNADGQPVAGMTLTMPIVFGDFQSAAPTRPLPVSPIEKGEPITRMAPPSRLP